MARVLIQISANSDSRANTLGFTMSGRITLLARVVACALASTIASRASATEGYILGGYGATQTSLSGAGVANSTDAMSMTLNPAGLTDIDRQFDLGLSLFAPVRSYDATGTLFVAPGAQNSSIPLFALPNGRLFAADRRNLGLGPRPLRQRRHEHLLPERYELWLFLPRGQRRLLRRARPA